MKRPVFFTMLAGLALTLAAGLAAAEQHENATTFNLVPKNAACLPDASGRVTVFHKEEDRGVDTLHLRVEGLPANTDFAVFLTSADAFASPPFGATEYIGDFTTNGAGRGSLKVDAIIGEAFLTTVSASGRTRTDLDHLVIWFADPAQVPACFNPFTPGPFDGDGASGPAALSSQGATGLELTP
jgi:hypothetical protein